MPIPLEDFEKGEDVPTLTPPIMKLLFDNLHKAFSVEEIEKAILGDQGKFVSIMLLIDVLMICNIIYFTIKHPSA